VECRKGVMRENSRWEDSLPWMKRMVCGGIAGGLAWFGSFCEGEKRVYASSTGIVGSSGGDASEVMFTVSTRDRGVDTSNPIDCPDSDGGLWKSYDRQQPRWSQQVEMLGKSNERIWPGRLGLGHSSFTQPL
jgi:hypothetical protein